MGGGSVHSVIAKRVEQYIECCWRVLVFLAILGVCGAFMVGVYTLVRVWEVIKPSIGL
jgi:hypothetical protein